VFVAAILLFAFPVRTKTATLLLTTASGEIQGLTSQDVAGVERVKRAIEDAFTTRG
jgi:hypothetical protein